VKLSWKYSVIHPRVEGFGGVVYTQGINERVTVLPVIIREGTEKSDICAKQEQLVSIGLKVPVNDIQIETPTRQWNTVMLCCNKEL
jgi:hypothetical protein